MTSTGPNALIVTRPLAFSAQPAFTTDCERAMLKKLLSAAAAVPGTLSMQPSVPIAAEIYLVIESSYPPQSVGKKSNWS
jgi:hypothetical protein